MSSFDSLPISRGRIVWAIQQTKSMTQASKIIGCCYDTFKKYAKLYDLWEPNQCGRGIPKRRKLKFNTPIDFDLERWDDAMREINLK